MTEEKKRREEKRRKVRPVPVNRKMSHLRPPSFTTSEKSNFRASY